MGACLPGFSLLLTLGLCLYGSWQLAGARDAYLRLALFHGPLELAVLTLLFLERRLPARGRSAPSGARAESRSAPSGARLNEGELGGT